MEEYTKLSIKDWAVEDRPREKLLQKGIQSLSDAELIAIIIGSGSRKESAVELSRKILKDVNNSLNKLGKISIESLQNQYHGIGQAKAITITAALELGRRRKHSEQSTPDKITSSQDVFHLLNPIIGELQHEEFWVIFLNRSNKIITHTKISQGGLSGTVIDTRLILKKGIDILASSLILCHNHPSGNLTPSNADRDITQKLKQAGNIMDIQVLDHIIISENAYFSFADESIL